MQIRIDLPEDLSAALEGRWQDVTRRALEAVAVEAYRTDALSHSQVSRLLGFDAPSQLHALLEQRHIPIGAADASVSGGGVAETGTAARTTIPSADRDFVRVGRSRIAGKGVFAKRRIPIGTRIIEYTGDHVPIASLSVLFSTGAAPPTYVLRLNETTAIDGACHGNDARFINHSCAPNCEVYVFDDHAYVYAMAEIARGDELTFDYKLRTARTGRKTTHAPDDQICRCGSSNCRGTMRSTKRQR